LLQSYLNRRKNTSSYFDSVQNSHHNLYITIYLYQRTVAMFECPNWVLKVNQMECWNSFDCKTNQEISRDTYYHIFYHDILYIHVQIPGSCVENIENYEYKVKNQADQQE